MNGKSIALFLAAGLALSTAAVCFADAAADLQQAANYKDNGYYKQAADLYSSIIAANPGTSYAFEAQKRLIIIYIVTERTNQTLSGINTLITVYAGNPGLPDALYWIAKRYREEGNADRAISIYQQIIIQYPNSTYAQKAKLDIPRTRILSLLNSEQYTGAEAAIDSLISNFSSDPQLSETLYDIGRACKMSGRYAKAKSLYQYILQHDPNGSYAELCPIQIPKMDIWSMIDSGNFSGAQTATSSLVTNFSADPELADTLHGIAIKYDAPEVKRYQDAQNLYQQIIQLSPNSKAANKATLDLAKDAILSRMDAGDSNGVLTAVDNMISTFNGNAYLPEVVSREIAKRYYQSALQLQVTDPNTANNYLRQAVAIWAKAIANLPGSGATAEGACLSGDCFQMLGNYQSAAQCYQTVVNNYPMYRRTWDALFKLGYIYEQMEQNGLISAASGDPIIRAAYSQLVAVYPECTVATHARQWLSH